KGVINGSATVPASRLARIKALHDVDAAAGGFLFEDVKLVDARGRPIEAKGGAPTRGFGVDPLEPRFNPLSLAAGRWARGPKELTIDAGTATRHGYKVGDTIGAQGAGAVGRY